MEDQGDYLVDVSDFFSSPGGGRGSARRRGARKGGAIGFLLKISGVGGEVFPGEGPGGCLRRIGEFFGGGEG